MDTHNLLWLGLDLITVGLLWRSPTRQRALMAIAGWVVAVSAVQLVQMTFIGMSGFGALRIWAWVGGLHLPALLLILGLRHRRVPLVVLALLIGLVDVEAFVVGPRALQVNTVEIVTPKLDAPLRIALIADLQTDNVGAFERRALEAVLAASPDLILFAGDTLQTPGGAVFKEQQQALSVLFRELQLSAPLGIVAVQGDVDRAGWEAPFQAIGAETVSASRALQRGPIRVTALSAHDSRSDAPPVQGSADFHVVLGHAPDFALADVDADLLLAGHTHGGQVQLPGIGPLMTLSRVPRDWASGHTEIAEGQHLIVSRGVGMERADAPRLRVLCRPEIVLVDLVPELGPKRASRELGPTQAAPAPDALGYGGGVEGVPSGAR